MNRRQFFSRVLGPIAATITVPELARTIFLPPRGGWPTADLSRYVTSKTAWFLKFPEGDFRTDNMRYISREHFSNAISPDPQLTEKSLEEMLAAMVREADALGRRLTYHPTHLIVHPSWTLEQVEARLAQL